MAWTDPKTWTAAVLSSSDLNTHLRDNLNALKEPPTDDHTVNEATDYSTTSTSFTNVDGTDLSLTITTTGGDVLVHFHGVMANASGGILLDFTVDGVRHSTDDGILRHGTNVACATTFTRLVTGLSAGSHTFVLQYKVTGGTGIIYAGAATGGFDVHPQFWVREVS